MIRTQKCRPGILCVAFSIASSPPKGVLHLGPFWIRQESEEIYFVYNLLTFVAQQSFWTRIDWNAAGGNGDLEISATKSSVAFCAANIPVRSQIVIISRGNQKSKPSLEDMFCANLERSTE
jgi:hypothetical protein